VTIRALLLADTHLGFDFPLRPRVERRRRGPDFFANTHRALAPARRGDVDLVIHGGDLLYRSKVPPELVRLALEPLLEVADNGTPVVLVPGNHERSALPYPLLAAHRHLHVFDQPRTIDLEIGGVHVALIGFPCERENIRTLFPDLIASTQWTPESFDISLLCCHQSFEGATVGPSDYTFRSGADIVPGVAIPESFAAVLSGHIHRHQVLRNDLKGRPLAAPVFYSGSIERISAAERYERKGYLTLDLESDRTGSGRVADWAFHPLPVRRWADLDLPRETLTKPADWFRKMAASMDADAIVRFRIDRSLGEEERQAFRAASLRALALPTQTVEVSWPRRRSTTNTR